MLTERESGVLRLYGVVLFGCALCFETTISVDLNELLSMMPTRQHTRYRTSLMLRLKTQRHSLLPCTQATGSKITAAWRNNPPDDGNYVIICLHAKANPFVRKGKES